MAFEQVIEMIKQLVAKSMGASGIEFDNIVNEALDTFSEDDLVKMGEEYAELNVGNRNKENVKTFTEKIMKKENKKMTKYERVLLSKSINALIYAATQVGKSKAMCDFIRVCLKDNVPVIVSSDNKTDQLEQLYERMKSELGDTDVKMIKIADTNFASMKKAFEESNNRVIMFCLDNSSQVEKMINSLAILHSRYDNVKSIKKIALIHDEADTVTKDKNTNTIIEDQAESHKKWIELVDFLNTKMSYVDFKRVFVTATPENCCMLYNIESPEVIKLESPPTYRGYKDIEYNVLEDDLDMRDILKHEIQRIKDDETNEVILYCIDRKIADGQDLVLVDMSKTLKCVVNTYNGNGIISIFRTVSKADKFENQLKKGKISYKRDSKTFTMRTLAIRKFYTMCKAIGEKCVVTIGKDLIARGISYVGEDEIHPLTATTIIYKPGMTMHSVGICQTIGRVTGCAMPELKRRVYAPEDVINTYRVYNENQEKYINKILKESAKTTKEIIKGMLFEKLQRGIDRSKLDLKMKMKTSSIPTESEDITRMQELLNNWWGASSIIGKILKFVYDSKTGVSETELKQFIENCGSNSPEKMYHHLITSSKEYKLIFERNESQTTKIREVARKYINENM
jgi:ribosomal protein L31E